MTNIIPRGDFPDAESKCWTLENFGHPHPNVHESTPYTRPELSSPHCDSHGCAVDLTARDMRKSLLLMSTHHLEAPRMIDRIKGCSEVEGVQISEVGLAMVEYKTLESTATDLEGLPVNISLSYKGCYVDNGRRAFRKKKGKQSMAGCVNEALKAGSSRFGMQYPQGSKDDQAECWLEDKGLLSEDGSTAYTKQDDSECKGEDWNPVFRGEEFTYNGNGWRNAVYDIVAVGTDGADTELSFHYKRLELPGAAGQAVHVQVLDTESCALSDVAVLELPDEEPHQ